MPQPYYFKADQTAPALKWVTVTPSDATTYSGMRGIFVGGTGDLSLEDQEGTISTFTVAAVPFVLPIGALRIRAATTATNVIALF